MNIQNIVEPTLKEIANNSLYQNFPNKFIYSNNIEEDALLFIGINPSSSSSDPEKQIESYSLLQENNEHQYFKKFEEIAKYCGVKWTHIDLLFFRETNQDTIHHILKQENGIKFLWEQLQLSGKLIQESKPKVIVIANALAGLFLGKERLRNEQVWLGYNFEFKENIGTYVWNNTPVFFTSMLTGQRALDSGSFERLKWHIKQVLK